MRVATPARVTARQCSFVASDGARSYRSAIIASVLVVCGALSLSGCSGAFWKDTGAPIDEGAARPPVETVSASPAKVHIVRPGDTLGRIARMYTGSAANWRSLADANPTIGPHRLEVGSEILVPLQSGTDVSSPPGDVGALPGDRGRFTRKNTAKQDRIKGATGKARGVASRARKSERKAARRASRSDTAVAARPSARGRLTSSTVVARETASPARRRSVREAAAKEDPAALPNHFFVCYRNRCATKKVS